MALITVTGEPGCRVEEVARISAQRLGWELLAPTRVQRLIAEEFGDEVPEEGYPHLLLAITARLARDHHLVVTGPGAEELNGGHFPALLRVWVGAPDAWRIGALMVDRRLERPAARDLLAELDREEKAARKRRRVRTVVRPGDFDVSLNAAAMDTDQLAALIAEAAGALRLAESGLLSASAEAKLVFRARLALSRHGIQPPDTVALRRAVFSHPSEEIFANLLDFYRIAWEYEPRSFPIQWDQDGRVMEAFTPDFYLPEFDLYVELTTMKQANVTRKNRKIKLLRAIYPSVNIQVFYQKDIENLIFKHGLTGRLIEA